MEIKTFEIRDRGTCISALAIRPSSRNLREHALFKRAGYGDEPSNYVLLADMDGGDFEMKSDAFKWGRTLNAAHLYISDHWNELTTGDLIDVQFILGETKQPKRTDLNAYL